MRYAIALCLLCLVGCGDSYRHERTKIADFTACDTSFTLYDEVIYKRGSFPSPRSSDRVVWRDTTIDKSFWSHLEADSFYVYFNDKRDSAYWVIDEGPTRGQSSDILTRRQIDSIVREDWFRENVSIDY